MRAARTSTPNQASGFRHNGKLIAHHILGFRVADVRGSDQDRSGRLRFVYRDGRIADGLSNDTRLGDDESGSNHDIVSSLRKDLLREVNAGTSACGALFDLADQYGSLDVDPVSH
jgi:hypothetical protein